MGLWSRLKQTIRGEHHHAEIDEELRFHLAMKAAEGQDARTARIRFGNPASIREETRAMGILAWMDSLLQDARYALRQIRRTPVLAAAVVLSLTIGIGANAAIFGVIDAALLKLLPVRDPRSLLIMEWTSEGWPEVLCNGHTGSTNGNPTTRMQGSSVAPSLHRRLSREQTAFESLMGFSDANDAAVVAGSRPAEQVDLQYVSDNFFSGLGVIPLLGRSFLPEDDRLGREPVVVISHRFWQRHFGGSQDVLGQTLRINSVAARVIGVAPRGFFGIQIGSWTDLYAPLAAHAALNPRIRLSDEPGEQDTYWWVRQIARLKPGANAEASREQLSALFQRMVVPEGVRMEPARIPALVIVRGARGYDPMGGDSSTALWILLLLVGVVLLIVCANVANLLMARSVARQRESAVRLALGAARLRLLRQQMVESLIFAVAGGGLGLLLGYVLAEGIHSLLQGGRTADGLDLRIDGRIVGYTAGLSILTALIFGLAPAVRSAKADVGEALKAHGRSVLAGRLRLPRALVVIQIALCLTVLVAAGLLSRSLANLRYADVGFERENLVYASVHPSRAGYKPEQVGPYIERLRAELAALPGVAQVAVSATRPLSGSTSSRPAHIPGRPFRQDGSDNVLIHRVTDGFLETLGIPLIAGRVLEPRDMRPKSEAVLVDESFAARFFPNQNPLGRRFGDGLKDSNKYEIVGVVKSSHYHSLRRTRMPIMYEPLLPHRMMGGGIHFAIRSRIDTRQLADGIRRAAAAIDPDVPVYEIQTQTSLIDRMLRTDRLLSVLSGAFSVVALILAAVGLAGLLAYAVARRTNEIGVRMALGAAPGDVVRMILRDSLWLVVAGILLGLPCAVAVARVLKSTLFGLQPADPVTALLSLSVLAVVAALAASIPASRAARIDPMVALRYE